MEAGAAVACFSRALRPMRSSEGSTILSSGEVLFLSLTPHSFPHVTPYFCYMPPEYFHEYSFPSHSNPFFTYVTPYSPHILPGFYFEILLFVFHSPNPRFPYVTRPFFPISHPGIFSDPSVVAGDEQLVGRSEHGLALELFAQKLGALRLCFSHEPIFPICHAPFSLYNFDISFRAQLFGTTPRHARADCFPKPQSAPVDFDDCSFSRERLFLA